MVIHAVLVSQTVTLPVVNSICCSKHHTSTSNPPLRPKVPSMSLTCPYLPLICLYIQVQELAGADP